MADLLDCLAGARRAREEAERRLDAEPTETLDDVLRAPTAREVLVLNCRRTETA